MWWCINYKHTSSQIQLFSLSDCFVCLVVGVGGKLSMPVYLVPHPPGYQSKIILLSFLILSIWMWWCIHYKHTSSQIQLFSLSDCFVCLVVGVGGKLSRPVYLAPHQTGYQSKIIVPILLIWTIWMWMYIIQVKFSCFLCQIVLYA